jgi:prostaglandin-E synthase 1
MMDLQANPAFSVFAVCAAILVLKMILVGHYTGVGRMRKKTYLNPEDAQQFSGMDEYQASEDPEIERGLRAHRNDLESTLPFLAIGLIYLLMGASSGLATGLFIGFTALRCVFSVFYLRGMQPWRSLSFLLAEACLLVMLFQILYWGISG